jgi:hypothetical protein
MNDAEHKKIKVQILIDKEIRVIDEMIAFYRDATEDSKDEKRKAYFQKSIDLLLEERRILQTPD